MRLSFGIAMASSSGKLSAASHGAAGGAAYLENWRRRYHRRARQGPQLERGARRGGTTWPRIATQPQGRHQGRRMSCPSTMARRL